MNTINTTTPRYALPPPMAEQSAKEAKKRRKLQGVTAEEELNFSDIMEKKKKVRPEEEEKQRQKALEKGYVHLGSSYPYDGRALCGTASVMGKICGTTLVPITTVVTCLPIMWYYECNVVLRV